MRVLGRHSESGGRRLGKKGFRGGRLSLVSKQTLAAHGKICHIDRFGGCSARKWTTHRATGTITLGNVGGLANQAGDDKLILLPSIDTELSLKLLRNRFLQQLSALGHNTTEFVSGCLFHV